MVVYGYSQLGFVTETAKDILLMGNTLYKSYIKARKCVLYAGNQSSIPEPVTKTDFEGNMHCTRVQLYRDTLCSVCPF